MKPILAARDVRAGDLSSDRDLDGTLSATLKHRHRIAPAGPDEHC